MSQPSVENHSVESHSAARDTLDKHLDIIKTATERLRVQVLSNCDHLIRAVSDSQERENLRNLMEAMIKGPIRLQVSKLEIIKQELESRNSELRKQASV